MQGQKTIQHESPDPAGVFACAKSLWVALGVEGSSERAEKLSDCYAGMDGLMREVMRIADMFENWACRHIEFGQLEGIWPYRMEKAFGRAVLKSLCDSALGQFDESDCLRAALSMELPVKATENLPVPLDIKRHANNPGEGFTGFQIQTMRIHLDAQEEMPYAAGDEPYDEELSEPYFAINGLLPDGTHERIAERETYCEARRILARLAPDLDFPEIPINGVESTLDLHTEL